MSEALIHSGIGRDLTILPERLGSEAFRQDHQVRYAYVVGGMVKGIASPNMIERLAEARLLGFLGTGGLRLEEIESTVRELHLRIGDRATWGVNFLHNILIPRAEEDLVDILLRYKVKRIEASAFMQVTPALVRYRLLGLTQVHGRIEIGHKIMAKVSRPEVATPFLSPADPAVVQRLMISGAISQEQASLARHVPMADDLCAEADSGGHTDKGVSFVMVPAFLRLRDELQGQGAGAVRTRVGTGGGIGTPEAAAAAFMLGAEFVLTGSINQCTVEARTSEAVKDRLAQAGVQDMTMAPAGDMFELGARVQVLRRGSLFPARANRLYDLYRQYEGLDSIPPEVRQEIQKKYFKRSFEEIWAETKSHYARVAPSECEAAEANPKKKMAMIFRWYFVHTNRLALEGSADSASEYQIHCGPAMGALNQWLRGTPMEHWRNRHVEGLAEALMRGAAEVYRQRIMKLCPG